ncbi:MAG: hypothetical protein ABWY25_10905, partial [Paenisporosarcina sp.]
MASRLQDVLLRDTRADQPAATDVAVGTLYFVTDENVIEQSDGTSWLPYSSTTSGVTQLTGDVTAGPGSGSLVATIPADTVTYAKMQNVSAASRLLGRGTAGTSDVREMTVDSTMTIAADVLGVATASLPKWTSSFKTT